MPKRFSNVPEHMREPPGRLVGPPAVLLEGPGHHDRAWVHDRTDLDRVALFDLHVLN